MLRLIKTFPKHKGSKEIEEQFQSNILNAKTGAIEFLRCAVLHPRVSSVQSITVLESDQINPHTGHRSIDCNRHQAIRLLNTLMNGGDLEFVSIKFVLENEACMLTVQFAPCFEEFSYALAHPEVVDSAIFMQEVEQAAIKNTIVVPEEKPPVKKKKKFSLLNWILK